MVARCRNCPTVLGGIHAKKLVVGGHDGGGGGVLAVEYDIVNEHMSI